jgi:hypothetical protein
MIRSLSEFSTACSRADFWSRACFISLSASIASATAFGFLSAQGVLADGVTTATTGGVLQAVFFGSAQFCALNLSHMARNRAGRDRQLCVAPDGRLRGGQRSWP